MPHRSQASPSGAGTAEFVNSDPIDPGPALVLSAIPMPSRSEFVRYWSELCDRPPESESPAAAQPIAEPIEPAPFSGSPLPTGKEEFTYWRSLWTMPAASEALGYWRGVWGREAPAGGSPAAAQPMAATHPMAEPGQGKPIVILAEVGPDFLARKMHGRRLRRLTAELMLAFLPFEAAQRNKIFRGAAVLVRMRNGEKPDCECGGPDGCVLSAESAQLFSRLS